MLTHGTEKPFVCTFEGCDKAFTQKAVLKTHEYTHTGTKPFQCTICERSFAQRTALGQCADALQWAA